MNFEEFIEEVVNDIRNFLPEDYENAEITVMDAHKLNESYKAMTVRKEGQLAAPTVDLRKCYEEVENGGDFYMTMRGIAELVQMQPKGLELNDITNYEKAKDRLFIRVSDAEKNAEILTGVPHKEECGLAITYHVFVDIGAEGVGSTMVNESLMREFGVTPEQLHKDAVENSPKIMPPEITSMEDKINIMMGLEAMSDEPVTFEQALEDIDFSKDRMFVLSNREGVNGASVIFYPEVLKQIGDKAGMNFFILPSSVHEQLIVPDDGSMSLEELTAMVKEVNTNEVAPKDVLSYTVLHYDSKEHMLEKGTDHKERMEEEKAVLKWADGFYNVRNIDTLAEVADVTDALEKRAEKEGLKPSEYIKKYEPTPDDIKKDMPAYNKPAKAKKHRDWDAR